MTNNKINNEKLILDTLLFFVMLVHLFFGIIGVGNHDAFMVSWNFYAFFLIYSSYAIGKLSWEATK